MLLLAHLPGIELEDHRLASSRSDLGRSLHFLGQMNVMPLASNHTLFQDRRQESLDGPVVERLGFSAGTMAEETWWSWDKQEFAP